MHLSSSRPWHALLAYDGSARPFERFESKVGSCLCATRTFGSVYSSTRPSCHVSLGPPVLWRAAHRRQAGRQSNPRVSARVLCRQTRVAACREPIERMITKNEHLDSWRSAFARNTRPNPSFERTATGEALGPRAGQCHHPSRGPSASPVAAAQLKR